MRLKLFTLLIAAITGVIVLFCLSPRDRNAELCREFLEKFGRLTENEVFDKEDITIPEKFDNIYESYNKLQLEAGLDLTPYRGKRGIRYTFVVTNYPLDIGEPVYANVICIDGTPVGGDIMTASVNGFMHSLSKDQP